MHADLDKESELFYDNINENLLVQHINVNTRHKLGNSPSILDLVFTNEDDMVEDIKCLVTSENMKINEHEATRLNYHKTDYNKIKMNRLFNTRGYTIQT